MAEIQYLVPGVGYINEDTDQREFLIPGVAYVNETSISDAAPPTLATRKSLLGVGI